MNPLLISIIAGLLGTAAAGGLGYWKGAAHQKIADTAKIDEQRLVAEELARRVVVTQQAGVDIASELLAARATRTETAFRPIDQGVLDHAATPAARVACPGADGVRIVQLAIDAANAALAETAGGGAAALPGPAARPGD